MADPVSYSPSYSFSGYQNTSPSKPLPAPRVDDELSKVGFSIASLVTAIKDVRRSDGALKNGSVTADALSPSLSIGFTMKGPWASGSSYLTGDGVSYSGGFYKARSAHTASSSNRPDLSAATWVYLWSTTDIGGAMSQATYDPTNKAADVYARGNHTGTQGISTVTGLQTALDSKGAASDVAAKLNRAGDTMTGPLVVPNTFTIKAATGTSLPQQVLKRSDDTVAAAIYWDYTANVFRIRGYDVAGSAVTSELTIGTNGSASFRFNSSDVWTDANAAAKAAAASLWTDASANAKLADTQTFGAIGSYAFLAHGSANTPIGQGTSYSGSLLRYAGFAGNTASNSATAPSGSWQAIGLAGAAVGLNSSTLFRRTA